MSKSILVLTGSPRKGGNSDKLADSFIKGAIAAGHSVHKIETAFKNIHPCIGCNVCIREGTKCVIHDDFDEIASILESADVIVFASPLYWGGVSGQLKIAWDRIHAYTRGKNRERHTVSESVLLITAHSDIKKAKPLVDIYKNCGNFMGWKDRGVIAVDGLLEKDDIIGNNALSEAEYLGEII
ncbi:MAG: flavodoxin family protein [Fusobacteriaceae bacterium]|jgi:multimeric flavodoxin WrbA|nr:flavodoxin family protein [Fusobacteriaceae bacterium]